MKRFRPSTLIYVLVFLTGAVAFLYPLVTNAINYHAQTQMIASYREEVAAYDNETYTGLKREAEQYNQFVASLEGNVTDVITDREQQTTSVVYMNVLSTGEVIGYVTIPKLDVELPIYRGTSDEVLSLGVGHLERSSLPIGGQNTHAVLMAHRGLPTTRLFRDLGFMEPGDVFFIDTLGTTLAYEVESTRIVLPTELESLQVQKGGDLCTLVTCEPYMINSHRLLVTGSRIEYVLGLEDLAPEGHITFTRKYWEYFVIAGSFVPSLVAIILIRRRRKQ